MPQPTWRVEGHEIDGPGGGSPLEHPLQRPDAQRPGLFPHGSAEPPGAARGTLRRRRGRTRGTAWLRGHFDHAAPQQ